MDGCLSQQLCLELRCDVSLRLAEKPVDGLLRQSKVSGYASCSEAADIFKTFCNNTSSSQIMPSGQATSGWTAD
jgi:hypothetical protein